MVFAEPGRMTCAPFGPALQKGFERAGESTWSLERRGVEPKNQPKALLTIEESAEYLRISRSSMYALIQQGRIKCVRVVQDSPRLKIADLDRLIDESQDDE